MPYDLRALENWLIAPAYRSQKQNNNEKKTLKNRHAQKKTAQVKKKQSEVENQLRHRD